MSASIRQENLYGAEDWRLVYTSFKNAEFKSYDFDTLRVAMLEYLQLNYPEEFNDYTQSSEFIALVDLVAFVGQNLSFRMDLNARENILDTAEKRESVLRIARMLSYKPKRVRPAEGLLQVVGVRTTEQIIDSVGNNLANQLVTWGADPSELEYERFIKIMDSGLSAVNKFGTPLQKVINNISGDRFEIYQFNNFNRKTEYNIPAVLNNRNYNFDVLPVQLSDDGIIEQVDPSESTAFTVLYRNDGKGTGSIRTGFFVLAKQGTQLNQLFRFEAPRANAVIDLSGTANISEDDFYVQTLDSQGNIVKNWTRVGAIDYSNLVVNQFGNSNKDLFEVIYSDADITSIKFGDGLFSNSAEGIIRVWYRTAENDFLRVKAGEISNKTIELEYINADGESHLLELIVRLQESMTTGIPSENVDEIKQNAPEAFYSKNRMVTGDDYAGFLPTLNNNTLLLKVENRTFAGYSRYTDLNDPTGKSRPLVEFADDGYMYYNEDVKRVAVADRSAVRPIDFIENQIELKLSNIGLLNFYYGKVDLESTGAADKFKLLDFSNKDYTWNPVYIDSDNSNGFITETNTSTLPVRLGLTTWGDMRPVKPGSIIKFNTPGTPSWAIINDIKGDGLGQENDVGDYTGLLANGHGTVEVEKSIADKCKILAIVPALPRIFDENTRAAITEYLVHKKPFALILDHTQPKWTVIDTTIYPINKTAKWNSSSYETSWLFYFERSAESWIINYRILDYVFGSESLMRFYNINFASTTDPSFKTIGRDDITIISMVNNKLVPQAQYRVTGYYTYDDGYTDNSKIKITPLDVDRDSLPDDPNHFLKVVGHEKIGLKEYKENEFTYLVPTTENDPDCLPGLESLPGKREIPFKWTHKIFVDQTLNPALTNIVDVYVLTKSYNDEFIKWKNKGATGLQPECQTSEELRREFKDIATYKMATDELIFHPVIFKPLFGATADENLQAQFKVVKYAKSKMTDNEIKSKVLAAIDSFFDIGNFDFGETFYFTELAAYIHTKLKTDINSVVIVPVNASSRFGSLFQITPNKNELITSTATVNDIVVIKEITDQNIRKA